MSETTPSAFDGARQSPTHIRADNPLPRFGWREFRRIRDRFFALAAKLCAYCGTTQGPFEVDHMDPMSRGGAHFERNLTIACRRCNRAKGAKTVNEFMATRFSYAKEGR